MKTRRILYMSLLALAGVLLVIVPQVMNIARADAEDAEKVPTEQGMSCSGMMNSNEAMGMHGQMHQMAAAMNERMNTLVSDMNAAKGSKKVDAMAVVLTELVAQRQEMLAAMSEGMMASGSGSLDQATSSMPQCPMMNTAGTTAQPEGGDSAAHTTHHQK